MTYRPSRRSFLAAGAAAPVSAALPAAAAGAENNKVSYIENSPPAWPIWRHMARTARALAVDSPHHVTQRGAGGQAVFFTERDREVYLNAFFDYATRFSLRVWGYCRRIIPTSAHSSLIASLV